MFRRLTALLTASLLLPAIFLIISHTLASGSIAPTAVTTPPPPPPLPNSCVTGGTAPDDYDQPVCCVSGYVYLDGQPVADAQVTITSENGASITDTTILTGTVPRPYYKSSLDTAPLNVEPGQSVTVTAVINAQSKTQTFTAREGGQQIDIVLPYNNVEAEWQHIAAPAARQNHEMAQCSAAGDLCIWGGSAAGGAQDDIMAWQGEFWQAFSPQNRPSARYAYRIAYDPVRQALILFGGYDGVNSLGDTWEWDGQTWTQLHPALSPPPRHAHAMAYDPVNHVILLFGG